MGKFICEVRFGWLGLVMYTVNHSLASHKVFHLKENHGQVHMRGEIWVADTCYTLCHTLLRDLGKENHWFHFVECLKKLA